MQFQLVVFVVSLAYACAGLLGAPVATYSSAPAVSSVYSSIGAPSVLAQSAPVSTLAHGLTRIQTQPIAKLAYSSAPAVSSVYSSIGAPSVLSHSALPLIQQVAINSPAIGTSQQSTIRSHAGTISQYSKAVDTAHSSVRKVDTRISNNGYALAPTYTQAIAPAPLLASSAIAHGSLLAGPAVAHAPLLAQRTVLAAPALEHSIVNHVSFNGLGASYAW